jgi:hypothetical protein
MWTGAAVVFKQRREVGSQATTMGPNTSHKDASFSALVDAVELTKDMLSDSPTRSVLIYTADHHVIPWCTNTGRHNNTTASRMISEALATILFKHPNTTVSIS